MSYNIQHDYYKLQAPTTSVNHFMGSKMIHLLFQLLYHSVLFRSKRQLLSMSTPDSKPDVLFQMYPWFVQS